MLPNLDAFRTDDVLSFSSGDHIDVSAVDYVCFTSSDDLDCTWGSGGQAYTIPAGDKRMINPDGEDIYFTTDCVIEVMY